MDNLLNSHEIIDRQRFYQLTGLTSQDFLENCSKFILTEKKLLKSSEKAYIVIEPYPDKKMGTNPDCAFSILIDKTVINDPDALIVMAIGKNPKGNQSDIEKNNDEWRLEQTRNNALTYSLRTLHKPIKMFVQTDLFIERTEHANEVDHDDLGENTLKCLNFWIGKADIVIPAWGHFDKKSSPDNLAEVTGRLKDSLEKVYVMALGMDKDGNTYPAHPIDTHLIRRSTGKLIKVEAIEGTKIDIKKQNH